MPEHDTRNPRGLGLGCVPGTDQAPLEHGTAFVLMDDADADLKHMGLELPTTHFDPNRAL
jgi:hypothetical protein